MPGMPDLDSLLGKSVSEICGNNFHDATANHCAHFVSHAMGFTFSFNCKEFVGGKKAPANIRVHEVFAQCPRVGHWKDADEDANQLVFVTRKDVVNLPAKTMQNIPQKHIGIYSRGSIYHYSNSDDRVVKQTPDEFLARFQAAYDGDQRLFFGEFPNSDLELHVDMTAATVPNDHYAFELRPQGGEWYARRADVAGSQEFLAGVEVKQPAKKFYGLYFPDAKYYGRRYEAADFVGLVDHWAYLLDVTAYCESKNRFNLINTYDRAHFTFGFYQLAAHTPRDNLILFFRAALLDEDFQKLFPDLELRGGRVFRVSSGGTATDLEEEFYDPQSEEYQLQRYMTYLNPERTKIDNQEVLHAARLVWWANEAPACADTQVRVANEILQRKFSDRYAQWYDLDGQLDVICSIIADIHHHGRGTKTQVRQALASPDSEGALLKIGSVDHAPRISALTTRLKKWKDAGLMGAKQYRADLNEFR